MREMRVRDDIPDPAIVSAPPSPPSACWTSVRQLLQLAGYDAINDLNRAIEHDRAALSATLPERRKVRTLASGDVEVTVEEGGAPHWDVRHKAAEHLYDLAGVRQRRDPEDDASRGPITIVVQMPSLTPPQVVLSAPRYEISLPSGESESAATPVAASRTPDPENVT